MTAPIALQLYTLREALAREFDRTVEKVARIGYLGVETAGFPGTSPQAASRLFTGLGLEVVGAHLPLPAGLRKNEVLDTLAALNCTRAICPYLPEEMFASPEAIQRVCQALNEAHETLAENGYRLGYHNHWWEFQPVAGRLAHEILREGLHPDIFFEIDTYWAQTAGADPVEVVRSLGPRAPLLHIKDGPAVKGEPMVPLGQGAMDIPAVCAAGTGFTDWLIVELDTTNVEVFQAVEESYHYLTGRGLAHGRKD